MRTEEVRSSLLWTLHYNKEHVLRKEACSTIVQLGCHDDEIVDMLQVIFPSNFVSLTFALKIEGV